MWLIIILWSVITLLTGCTLDSTKQNSQVKPITRIQNNEISITTTTGSKKQNEISTKETKEILNLVNEILK